MSRKITFSLFVLFFGISFVSSSQNGFTSEPYFNFLLNGIDAGGTIQKSDSILSVTCSDGKTYGILSIEMSYPQKNGRVSGNTLSKEMRQFLYSAKKGEIIDFLLKLRAPNGPIFAFVVKCVVD